MPANSRGRKVSASVAAAWSECTVDHTFIPLHDDPDAGANAFVDQLYVLRSGRCSWIEGADAYRAAEVGTSFVAAVARLGLFTVSVGSGGFESVIPIIIGR